MRRLRARGQPVQHFHALAFALGLDAVAEHELGPGLVHARIEPEAAALGWVLNGPSRKHFGNLGHIALRVAAVHAQCVQFQQLAAVVFIEAAGALAWPRPRGRIPVPVRSWMRRDSQSFGGVRPHAQPIVQVEQHGRTFRCGHEQVLEFAERMRADDIALIAGQHQTVESFVHEHVEVVEPKVGHYLFKLTLAVDGAQKFRLRQFVRNHARRVVHGEQSFLLFWGQTFEDLRRFASAQRIGNRKLCRDRHAENFLETLVRRKARQLLDFEVGIELRLAQARLLFFIRRQLR